MKKFLLCFLVLTAVSPVKAQTVLYDLNDTVFSGTAGANTFLAGPGSLSQPSPGSSITQTLGTSGNFSYSVGYFDLTSLLALGDSLTISYAVDTSSITTFQNSDQQFRVGLFNSGGSQLTANVGTTSATFNGYDGYVGTYRPNGASGAANTLRERTGTNDLLWSGGSYTTLSGAPTLVSPGTGDFTGSFKLTLVASGVEISSVINGGAAQTVIDTTGTLTSFDTFSIFANPLNNSPTLVFTALSVTTSVPEPSVVGLVGCGLGLGLLRRRRN